MRPLAVLAAAGGLFLTSHGVAPVPDEDPGWPREIAAEGEVTVLLYQPQIDTFSADSIAARAAVAVLETPGSEPVFGAVWLVARLSIDRDARVVDIVEVAVPRVRFPDASEEHQQQLARLLEREIPTWGLTIALDRFLTALENAEVGGSAVGELNTAAPTLLVRYEPTVLVTIDGEPDLRAVEGSELQRVFNTPFTIVHDPAAGRYYLHAGGQNWYIAPSLSGEWQLTDAVPGQVARLAPPEDPDAEEPPEDEVVDDRVPTVVVTTEPAELLLFDGEPAWAPLGDGDLLYATNAESDVFRDVASQRWYLLISGRWYAGGSVEGPWTFVAADSLPRGFAAIDPDSEKGSVRAHVGGTDEALDAVLDAQIPQTAAITRGAVDVEVSYDGEPRFERIDGTEMQYAVNTGFTVLLIGGKYHLCHDGVWYESLAPHGPWETSVSVPGEVQQIPPTNPHYNVRYVNVYHYTPSVVYVGYYPGYMGWYVYGPTVVWGTGYWYRPWIGPGYYYPRPVTYGLSVRYHPYYGWSFGVGVRWGPVHFSYRSYPRYRGWYGPGGYRPYYPPRPTPYAGRPSTGARPARPATMPSNNIYDRPATRDRLAPRPSTSDRREPPVAATRENNVFTDRNGNVYQRTQDGWQRREGSGWTPAPEIGARPGQPAARPQPSQPAARPQPSQPAARPQPSQPSARPQPAQPSVRPSTPRPSTGGLERDYQARQRGNTRVDNFNRSQARPAPRAAPARRR